MASFIHKCACRELWNCYVYHFGLDICVDEHSYQGSLRAQLELELSRVKLHQIAAFK